MATRCVEQATAHQHNDRDPEDVHFFEVVASANGDLLSPAYVRWRIDEK